MVSKQNKSGVTVYTHGPKWKRGSKWVASWARFLQRNEGVAVEPDTGMLGFTAGRLHHASLSGNSEIKKQFSKLASALCAGVREFRPPRRRIRAELSSMISSGQITNRQRVKRLVEKPGNGTCADCGAAGRSVGVRVASVKIFKKKQKKHSQLVTPSCVLNLQIQCVKEVDKG